MKILYSENAMMVFAQRWWTDPVDIRHRLDEVDKCLGRRTLIATAIKELQNERSLLHVMLIAAQLKNFSQE